MPKLDGWRRWRWTGTYADSGSSGLAAAALWTAVSSIIVARRLDLLLYGYVRRVHTLLCNCYWSDEAAAVRSSSSGTVAENISVADPAGIPFLVTWFTDVRLAVASAFNKLKVDVLRHSQPGIEGTIIAGASFLVSLYWDDWMALLVAVGIVASIFLAMMLS